MFGGYYVSPAEQEARKKEREEFKALWDEWYKEFLEGAEKQGVSRMLADDPYTLCHLSKLLETARACLISLNEAKRVLIPDLLRQLKRTGIPPPVQ